MSAPLDPVVLMKAYAAGVFPMADSRDAQEVYWVEPQKRGILPLASFRLSRSLAKTLKSERFTSTADAAFPAVVGLCAQATPDRADTWINPQIEQAVALLHAQGQAHSIETWLDGELVGGLYGIRLGRAFFGESMFSRATDASKVALAHLVARLRIGGFTLLDCQFITPHLASLGAIEIDRAAYVSLLSSALLSREGDFRAFDLPLPGESASPPPRTTVVSGPVSGKRILQSLAQTS
jgi:leucyl/phenylalanyl-tRNA---protein transferase